MMRITLLILVLTQFAAVAAVDCDEATGLTCHKNAECEASLGCYCPPGLIGDGTSCSSTGYQFLVTVEQSSIPVANGMITDWATYRAGVAAQLGLTGTGITSMDFSIFEIDAATFISFHGIFATKPLAEAAFGAFTTADFFYDGRAHTITNKGVYTWVAETSGAPVSVKPTGMEVTDVYFVPSCGTVGVGCWTIDVIYTTGEDAINVFYVPQAVGDDTLSYNNDYTSVQNTFFPAMHPCGNDRYTGADTDSISACCFGDFIGDYRPTESFVTWGGSASTPMCPAGDAVTIERKDDGSSFDVALPTQQQFLQGKFKGMTNSPGASFTGVVDPLIRQYTARIELDEKELRTLAGKLKGTVGVEHTIDTFLGHANFKPTGLAVLDTMVTQTAIHLEKTSFFTVSTHGEMQETFTEYTNVRIVRVCPEDADLSETSSEFDQSSWRNENTGCWDYLQVTLTLPDNLQPNTEDLTDNSPGSPAHGNDDPAESPEEGSPSTGGGDDVEGGGDEAACTDTDCCIGDGCDCSSGTCACSGVGTCCLGANCDLCYGSGCVDFECTEALSDQCCFGAGCADALDLATGEYDCTGDDCCVGSECNDCVGDDCNAPTCLGSGCDCDGDGCSCDGSSADCCIGEHCNVCVGTGCVEDVCEGDNCCVGDCDPSGACEDNGVCCIGASCSECHGSGCTSNSCFGDECLCSGGSCSCPAGSTDTACCLGEGCSSIPDGGECVGTTCTSASCIGSGCDCDSAGCSCPAGSEECCIGSSCTEDPDGNGCYGAGCDGSGGCDAEGACCTGASCVECHGPACSSSSCRGADCDCAGGSCTCDGDDCCIGSTCDECSGADCTPQGTCEGDACCIGAGCDNGSCDGAGDCCVGEACNECYGACSAPTCVGDECACTGDSCTCAEESEQCCIGTGCTECLGLDCGEDGEECAEGGQCCHGAGCNPDGTCGSNGLDCCVGLGCVECEGESCYEPGPCNGAEGLIPFDSVLAGQGTFMSNPNDGEGNAGMKHMCQEYCAADQTAVEAVLAQDCAPNSEMCVNPVTVGDQFVSFNIPLGTDWLPPASDQLDSNVFVSFALNVQDTNDGSVKRTQVQASVPVVEGGVNQFCDGIVAKTDLKDVANVDIVIGTAMTYDEISRLRILEDVASTGMERRDPEVINTVSIEAGLMTLVIKGNQSYFSATGTGSGSGGYRLELEDVITVHIMESDTCTDCAETFVTGLVEAVGADNINASLGDGNGALDEDGYYLNGAFRFEVNREQNRASLEPTAELLARCPFNPTRPSASDLFPSTCVTRRDVRYRGFPSRVGGYSTAIELPPASVDGAAGDRTDMEEFMTTVLGASDNVRKLGDQYSKHIATKYTLNGATIRAWFINPGYEWTPTQTGPQSIFTLSQKLFMFCLINLNEGFDAEPTSGGAMYPLPATLPDLGASIYDARRRSKPISRRLFSSDVADGGSQMSTNQMKFDVSPKTLLASAYDVSSDSIAILQVEFALNDQQACMEGSELKELLHQNLEDAMQAAASKHETVQILQFSVERGDLECAGARRRLLNTGSAYTVVQVAVVFTKGTIGKLDYVELEENWVSSVKPLDVSPKVVECTEVNPDVECVPDDEKNTNEETEEKSGGGGVSTALIAGIAGGVGGLLVLVVGGFLFFKSREPEQAMPVESITIESLKQSLAEGV